MARGCNKTIRQSRPIGLWRDFRPANVGRGRASNLACQIAQKLFAFDLIQERPGRSSAAGVAWIEKTDLTFEFWLQQVIIGTQIVSSYLLGIMPKVLRLIRLKRVEKSFRLV